MEGTIPGHSAASRGAVYSLLKKDSGHKATAAPTQLSASAFTLTRTSLSGTKAAKEPPGCHLELQSSKHLVSKKAKTRFPEAAAAPPSNQYNLRSRSPASADRQPGSGARLLKPGFPASLPGRPLTVSLPREQKRSRQEADTMGEGRRVVVVRLPDVPSDAAGLEQRNRHLLV